MHPTLAGGEFDDVTKYESIFAAHGTELSVRLATTSIETRHHRRDLNSPLLDVACGVVAPFVVAYVAWILETSRRHGLERLYFLSRDGAILIDAARVMVEATGGPELRYLYGGRMAWGLPALTSADTVEWEAFVDAVVMKHTRVSVAGIATRTGLDVDELLLIAGVPEDADLDVEGREKLRTALLDAPLKDRIAERAAEQRALTRGYLRQEGFADSLRMGIVDVGWIGNTMRALETLLDGWAPPPRALFAGLTGHRGDVPGGVDAFLWGADQPELTSSEVGLSALIEMFCSGTHGPVVGYRADGRAVLPELLTPNSTARDVWALDDLHEIVSDFTRRFCIGLETLPPIEGEREAILTVLRMLRDDPSPDEATLWGAFPKEEDPHGDSVYPLARPFEIGDLAPLVRRGPFAGRNLAWPAAALRQTEPVLRVIFRLVLASSSWARRLRD